MLAGLREILVFAQAKADDFERMVEQTSRKHPVARRLRTIPGIGPYLALALAVEIGDISRFPGPAQQRGYSGLVPAVYQSGDKDARGPLTKAGNLGLVARNPLLSRGVPAPAFTRPECRQGPCPRATGHGTARKPREPKADPTARSLQGSPPPRRPARCALRAAKPQGQ